jgi:hypothetical protein
MMDNDISLKNISVFLMGANEIFGIEEVIGRKDKREVTVKCTVNGS